MIEPGAPSRTYANSGASETRGRGKKVTSEQVQEADAILQDDALGLEGKALTWDQLATEVGALKTGIVYVSAMKFILAMGLKDSYGLSGARVHVIVMIVSSISHLLQVKRRIGNANIVGLRWDITSSRTLSFTMCLATRTANLPTKSTLTLSSSQLLNPG